MEQFEKAFNEKLNSQSTWIKDVKQAAFEKFKEAGFPTRKGEDWRYVNLKPITELEYTFSSSNTDDLSEALESFSDISEHRLVFVNGTLDTTLSTDMNKLGIEVKSIFDAIKSDESLLKQDFSEVSLEDSFEYLNTAMFDTGLFIKVPESKSILDSLQIIHLNNTDSALSSNTRNFILLEENSNLQICESFISIKGSSFSNLRTNILVEGGAKLKYTRIMDENQESSQIYSTKVDQKAGSCLEAFLFNSGGALCRNNFRVNFLEEGASADVNGFYMVKDKQVVDNHIYVNHAVPNCNGNQLFKGILDGQSKAVFDGMVYVNKGAHGTESEQLNKNLLLKSTAEADSKPQLEIYNDDVACSHGSTLGQLDQDELFYLQSRAIPPEKAMQMLLFGFAEDVLFKISSKAIREKVVGIFRQRFSSFEV